MSNFSKKVLVDQAELDRMQQRQLAEYSPDLHSLARLQTNIAEVLARKDLTAEEKLNLMSTYTSRFDKLKKETGVLTGNPPVAEPVVVKQNQDRQNALKQNQDRQAFKRLEEQLKKVDNDEWESDDSSSSSRGAEDWDDDEDDHEHEEEVAIRDDKPKIPFKSIDYARRIGILPMYQEKAARLLDKIAGHEELLSRNQRGEVVVRGETIPKSNFDLILRTLLGPNHVMDQPGLHMFMSVLKELGIRTDELCGKQIHNLYSTIPLPPSKSHSHQSVAHASSSSHSHPNSPKLFTSYKSVTLTPKKDQSGKGPPGKRAKILYVY